MARARHAAERWTHSDGAVPNLPELIATKCVSYAAENMVRKALKAHVQPNVFDVHGAIDSLSQLGFNMHDVLKLVQVAHGDYVYGFPVDIVGKVWCVSLTCGWIARADTLIDCARMTSFNTRSFPFVLCTRTHIKAP